MAAVLDFSGSVFGIVGPRANGVTWVWAQSDLDMASESTARAELAEVLGVLVERVVTGEGLEVPVHVREDEAHEDEAARRHRELQRDRGACCPRTLHQGGAGVSELS